MIVNIHGGNIYYNKQNLSIYLGPHGSSTCIMGAMKQIFYLLGFSILEVNYRGSAGYG